MYVAENLLWPTARGAPQGLLPAAAPGLPVSSPAPPLPVVIPGGISVVARERPPHLKDS